MDLFEARAEELNQKDAPLAERLRPASLEEFAGQDHLVGKDGPIRKMIETDRFPPMIFWGPPGSGKTTLARIIAKKTKSRFVFFSAVENGLPEFRRIVKEAQDAKKFHNARTVLFVDEVHRLNKAQQDAFLPHVESGLIKLIGATTENPSFEVIPALLSRCQVFTLHALGDDELLRVLEKGAGDTGLEFSEEGKKVLVAFSRGDARMLLNQLETLLHLLDGKTATPELIEEALRKKAMLYDKSGEEHYNIISAFIKSMRDSDPDAALYWLARMLEGGEDPLFIARRMVVFASEDIGLADPAALPLALAVKEAVHFVGMPEARISLAHGVCFLALAPKNNRAYMGIEKALGEARESGPLPVPMNIRNAPTNLMKKMGYGKGYKYAHDFDGAKTGQQLLPDAIKGKKFF